MLTGEHAAALRESAQMDNVRGQCEVVVQPFIPGVLGESRPGGLALCQLSAASAEVLQLLRVLFASKIKTLAQTGVKDSDGPFLLGTRVLLANSGHCGLVREVPVAPTPAADRALAPGAAGDGARGRGQGGRGRGRGRGGRVGRGGTAAMQESGATGGAAAAAAAADNEDASDSSESEDEAAEAEAVSDFTMIVDLHLSGGAVQEYKASNLVMWPIPGECTWAVSVDCGVAVKFVKSAVGRLFEAECGHIVGSFTDKNLAIFVFDIVSSPLAVFSAMGLSLDGKQLQLGNVVMIEPAPQHLASRLREKLRPCGLVLSVSFFKGRAVATFSRQDDAKKALELKHVSLLPPQQEQQEDVGSDDDSVTSLASSLASRHVSSDESEVDEELGGGMGIGGGGAAAAQPGRDRTQARGRGRRGRGGGRRPEPANLDRVAISGVGSIRLVVNSWPVGDESGNHCLNDYLRVAEARGRKINPETLSPAQKANPSETVKTLLQQRTSVCFPTVDHELFESPPCARGLQCIHSHTAPLRMCPRGSSCKGPCSAFLHERDFAAFKKHNLWCPAKSFAEALRNKGLYAEQLQSRLENTRNRLHERKGDLREQLEDLLSNHTNTPADVANMREAIDDNLALIADYVKDIERVASELSDCIVWGEATFSQLRSLNRQQQRLDNFLPMLKRHEAVGSFLRKSRKGVMVLEAETGAGKSTQLVQYVLEHLAYGNVICTQPRDFACDALAERVSKELGVANDTLVKSRTGAGRVERRQDRQTAGGRQRNEHARIEFMTDKVLFNELSRDKMLSKYRVVVVDEVHERSLYTDLIIPFLCAALAQRTTPLHVFVTSATMDTACLVKYFQSDKELAKKGVTIESLQVKGRQFAIRDVYSERSQQYVDAAVQVVQRMHQEVAFSDQDPADMLVFFPCPSDIVEAKMKLERNKAEFDNVEILPLHARLSATEQKKVFDRYPGKRKIVLATNMAESSITIDGVVVVIDTGLAEQEVFDKARNMSIMRVGTISQASAKQRRGRAGRTRHGVCFRLYSKEELLSYPLNSTPEILRSDPLEAYLVLTDLVGEELNSLRFVDPPSAEMRREAKFTLSCLGALDEGNPGVLSNLGKLMVRLRRSPRLVRFVTRCMELGILEMGILLATTIAHATDIVHDKLEEKFLPRYVHGQCMVLGDLVGLARAVAEAWSCSHHIMHVGKMRDALKEFAVPIGLRWKTLEKAVLDMRSWFSQLQRFFDDLVMPALDVHPGHVTFPDDLRHFYLDNEEGLGRARHALVKAYFDQIVWKREGNQALHGKLRQKVFIEQKNRITPLASLTDGDEILYLEMADYRGRTVIDIVVPVPAASGCLAQDIIPAAFFRTEWTAQLQEGRRPVARTVIIKDLSDIVFKGLLRNASVWRPLAERYCDMQINENACTIQFVGQEAAALQAEREVRDFARKLRELLVKRTYEYELQADCGVYLLAGPGFSTVQLLPNDQHYTGVKFSWSDVSTSALQGDASSNSGRLFDDVHAERVARPDVHRISGYAASTAMNDAQFLEFMGRLVGEKNLRQYRLACDKLRTERRSARPSLAGNDDAAAVAAAFAHLTLETVDLQILLSAHIYTLDTGNESVYSSVNQALAKKDEAKILDALPFISVLRSACLAPPAPLRTSDGRSKLFRGTAFVRADADAYVPGYACEWLQFVSTSRNRDVAGAFAMNRRAEQTKLLFELDRSQHPALAAVGLNLESLSDYPDEEEVLLPPGTTLYVVSRTHDANLGLDIVCAQLLPYPEPRRQPAAVVRNPDSLLVNMATKLFEEFRRYNATDIQVRSGPRSGNGCAFFSSTVEAQRCVRRSPIVVDGTHVDIVPFSRNSGQQVRARVQMTLTHDEFSGFASATLCSKVDADRAHAKKTATFMDRHGKPHSISIQRPTKAKDDRGARTLRLDGFPPAATLFEIDMWVEATMGPLQAKCHMRMNKNDQQPSYESDILRGLFRSVISEAVGAGFTGAIEFPPKEEDKDRNFYNALVFCNTAEEAEMLCVTIPTLQGSAQDGFWSAYPDVGCTVRVPHHPADWRPYSTLGNGASAQIDKIREKFKDVAVKLLIEAKSVLYLVTGSVTKNIEAVAKALQSFVTGRAVLTPPDKTEMVLRWYSPSFRDFLKKQQATFPGSLCVFKMSRVSLVGETGDLDALERSIKNFLADDGVQVRDRVFLPPRLKSAAKPIIDEVKRDFAVAVEEEAVGTGKAKILFVCGPASRVAPAAARLKEGVKVALRAAGRGGVDAQEIDCAICMCSYPPEDIMVLACSPSGAAGGGTPEPPHAICRKGCMEGFINHALQSNDFPVKCAQCSQLLLLSEVEAMLGASGISTRGAARASLRAHIAGNAATLVSCTTVNCIGFHERREKSTCAFCSATRCGLCHFDWKDHEGMSCAQLREKLDRERRMKVEEENEQKLRVLLGTMGGKTCPVCHNYVVKSEGCNAVTCRCGCGFCYLCGKNCGRDAHSHFGERGACYGKLFEGVYDFNN